MLGTISDLPWEMAARATSDIFLSSINKCHVTSLLSAMRESDLPTLLGKFCLSHPIWHKDHYSALFLTREQVC